MLTTLTPLDPAAFPGRPATPWDLLSFAWVATDATSVTSTWLTGPQAGLTLERTSAFDLTGDGDSAPVLLTDPTGAVAPSGLDLDFRNDPDKAARHLIHTDGLGLTMYTPQGEPQAVYRVPAGTWTQFTPDQVYAQNEQTYQQIAEGFTRLGATAAVVGLDDGTAAEILDATNPDRAFQVYGAWLSYGDAPVGWLLLVGHRDEHGYFRYQEEETGETQDLRYLNLPLNASTDVIVERAAALINQIAPGALTGKATQ